jgi:selenocysteine-specific elongation factor
LPNDNDVTPKNLILATAGHVDHGKTALVQALTGTNTDRLPEEKARGITIDLGFAHLALPGFSLGIIDVPGHEDFIRNMIAGIGSIDLALLVVAADDGWMPQTEEHLQILDYLGVTNAVVAITKCDLGDPDRVAEEARQRLQESSLGGAAIVFTSVRESLGLDLLKEALRRECEHVLTPREVGKPRLFVDRAFTMRGSGTIVTGTLTGGRFARGDTISLQPQNVPARIRAIQSHNQDQESVGPGTRVALNLPDVRLAQIPRGTLITSAARAASSRSVDLVLRRSARMPRAAARALKSGSLVQVHYGSGRQTARMTFFDRSELAAGEEAIARLSFSAPVFVFAGDHLVLRDSAARQTIAGGIVLDPDADGTKFRSSAQHDFLRARATAPNDLSLLLRTQLRRDGWAQSETVLLKSNFSREEIAAAIREMVEAKELFQRDGIVADSEWWRAFSAEAAKAIDAAHAANPNQTGLDLRQLRTSLGIADAALFDALISDLCENGFARAQSAIRRKDHRLTLPPRLQPAGDDIRAVLAARPFDPPSRKELIRGGEAADALRFLCQTGEVILLSEEITLGATAFAEMKSRITEALRERGAATTSELRQALGTSRRILIPLLEYLDRIGLTTRQGDRRTLRERLR